MFASLYLIIKAISLLWSVRHSFYSFTLPPNLYIPLIIKEGTFLPPVFPTFFVRPPVYVLVRRGITFRPSLISIPSPR